MEAVFFSETSASFVKLHGSTSQKIVIFKDAFSSVVCMKICSALVRRII
jgi:hypothetical protein